MATSKINNLIDDTKLSFDGFALDANSITTPFAVANGWHSSTTNYPSGFSNMFGVVLTVWGYAGEMGLLDKFRVQVLISEAGKVYFRTYQNAAWGNWAWLA